MMIQFYLIIVTIVLGVSPNCNGAEINHGVAQVEWLRSKGGFFNPKIEFRGNAGDIQSPQSPVASQQIAKGEMLMIIPQHCLITGGETREDICDTVYAVIEEYRLGSKSEFAPYLEYAFSRERRQVPSLWSQNGKNLLHKIIGEEMEPQEVAGYSFKEDCDGTGDPLEEEAYMLVISRGWDNKMVPIYDMINHRGGNWSNVDSNTAHMNNDLFVFASRDIAVGEELYYSYNECTDCDGLPLTFAMQHMLKDFGFVEQFPRRFLFPAGEYEVVFDLERSDDGQGYTVTWLNGRPTKEETEDLKGHFERLAGLKEFVYEFAKKHVFSSHEREVAIEFYEAITIALEQAIAVATEEEDDDEFDDGQEEEQAIAAATEEEDDVELDDGHEEL